MMTPNSETEAPRAPQEAASKTLNRDWTRGLSVAADRAERIVIAARTAADKLELVGFRGAAEDVRRVCRSNQNYRTTCRQLYLDNVALRERIDQLEAEK